MVFVALALSIVCGATAAYAATDGGGAFSAAADAREGSFDDRGIVIVYDDAGDEGLAPLKGIRMRGSLLARGIKFQELVSEATDKTGSVVYAEVGDSVGIDEAISRAEQIDGVAYAQPNYTYHLLENGTSTAGSVADDAADGAAGASAGSLALPNDPALTAPYESRASQYYLRGEDYGQDGMLISRGANVVEAWDYARCSGNVTVAVLDTGVDFSHDDLKDNILAEYAYDAYEGMHLAPREGFCGDYAGHGTHVAGIVAAVADNGVGVAGASYNANVLPVKVFDNRSDEPDCSTVTLVKAYTYLLSLVDRGVIDNLHVINMSLGGYGTLDEEDRALHEQIVRATEKDILTVCAGGNGNSVSTPYTMTSYPSDFEECLAVTSLEADGTNSIWSDYNMAKDISAPGASLYSTYNDPDSPYARFSGTSMSSPLVAGIAALLWAVDDDASVDDVVTAIKATADPIDDEGDWYHRWPEKTGSAGAINAKEAVLYLPNATMKAPDGFSKLVRTQSVQLDAEVEGEEAPGERLVWSWSVVGDEGVATVTPQGLLTGVGVGQAQVVAEAYAASGKRYVARMDVSVVDIELAGAISATQACDQAIEVTWPAAEGAAAYRVVRCQQEISAGGSVVEDNARGYEAVATVPSTGAATYAYKDAGARPSTLYAYKVIPLGTLSGNEVEGAESLPCRGVRYDAVSSMTSQADVADAFLLRAALLESPVEEVVVVGRGSAFAPCAMGLAGVSATPVFVVDPARLSEDVAAAMKALEPKRIVVVGNEQDVGQSVVQSLAASAPRASVERVSGATGSAVAESVYARQKGAWGDVAVLMSADEGSLASILGMTSYLHAHAVPVFFPNEQGALSVATRQNLAAGGFKKVLIWGGEDAVSPVAEDAVSALGIPCERLEVSNVYQASSLAARLMLGDALAGVKANCFASASASSWSAASLLGSEGIPLLIVDEKAEDVLVDVVKPGSSAADAKPLVFVDLGSPLGAAEKKRVEDYVSGKALDPAPRPAATAVDLSQAVIQPIPEQLWTGEPVTPDVKVVYGDAELQAGEDFDLSFEDNIAIGTATAKLVGRGAYSGEAAAEFSIVSAVVKGGMYGDVTRFQEGEWYVASGAIDFVSARGLMTGYSDSGLFGVGKPLTRAELAVILWRYADPQEAGAYAAAAAENATGMRDVESGTWYTGAANWAVRNGVVNGFDEGNGVRSFGPNDVVSAEQMLTILANLTASRVEVSRADLSALDKFVDGERVSAWARPCVAWAAECGLVNGYDAQGVYELRPEESVMRERAAAFFMNAFDLGLMG